MSIHPVNSSEEYMRLLNTDRDVSMREAPLLGVKIGYLISAPFTQIPCSLYAFGGKIFSLITPQIPEEKGAIFLTEKTFNKHNFNLDDEESIQLKKNFAAIFNILKKHSEFRNVSILYNPEKSSLFSDEVAASYANGQIIFTTDLAKLTEAEAEWLLGHELSHYIHKDAWSKDACSLLGGIASVMLYLNHSFFAFYASQVLIYKGMNFLSKSLEKRADLYGMKLLNTNEGFVSLYTKIVIGQSTLFLLQNQRMHALFKELPVAEQVQVLRSISEKEKGSFSITHPSPGERLKLAEGFTR